MNRSPSPSHLPRNVGIIGAGPAGLTAAYQLAKAGIAVEVFEADGSVGGLARSMDLWGQRVDLGPHRFFSQDSRVNRLWLEVAQGRYRMVDRLTRIYYRRRFFDYPLKPANALINMGFGNAAACLASYFKQQLSSPPKSDESPSFEDWVVERFGRKLFEMFFQSYSEKLWGIPCQELDADFAAQRIKKFTLGEAIKKALGLGGKHHKTLVDRFAYPLGGTGMIYENMARETERRGGKIHLKCPVAGVVMEARKAVGLKLTDGSVRPFDHVISSMPLTLLVRSLGQAPPPVLDAVARLRFRNTILVFLEVADQQLFPDQWLYIHSPELQFGRVTNFRNWTPELTGRSECTILCLEYWCYEQDAIWSESPDQQIERAKAEIRATGLVPERSAIRQGFVLRLPRCYPVYARGYKTLLKPVIEFLRQVEGLTAIGRYGSFKYNNQDHSILMGILAAENLLGQGSHDLWAVNTDYESYQESSHIEATGLVSDTSNREA